ncbi:DUF6390 family protein [Patescibacteria group bacterium]
MNSNGLALTARYAYPPNSFSLCGPNKQSDLAWYSATQKITKGTKEILENFSTLFPYLTLIARYNNISDPFDPRVVEAYWIGNELLLQVPAHALGNLITDTLQIKKKITKGQMSKLTHKINKQAYPHHTFHVLNVYKRTGHDPSTHTLQTVDACIINWGKVINKSSTSITILTKPLQYINEKLIFGKQIQRVIKLQGENDVQAKHIKTGTIVSYHWGYVCNTLSQHQLLNLQKFTYHAIAHVNNTNTRS